MLPYFPILNLLWRDEGILSPILGQVVPAEYPAEPCGVVRSGSIWGTTGVTPDS